MSCSNTSIHVTLVRLNVWRHHIPRICHAHQEWAAVLVVSWLFTVHNELTGFRNYMRLAANFLVLKTFGIQHHHGSWCSCPASSRISWIPNFNHLLNACMHGADYIYISVVVKNYFTQSNVCCVYMCLQIRLFIKILYHNNS